MSQNDAHKCITHDASIPNKFADLNINVELATPIRSEWNQRKRILDTNKIGGKIATKENNTTFSARHQGTQMEGQSLCIDPTLFWKRLRPALSPQLGCEDWGAEFQWKVGLPDGFFSNQKSQFVWSLEGLATEDVSIFYVHLVNFPVIWHILWPFGIFPHVLVHFYPFWYVVPRKIWQPWWKVENGILLRESSNKVEPKILCWAIRHISAMKKRKQ
jgi:hypothetical protein